MEVQFELELKFEKSVIFTNFISEQRNIKNTEPLKKEDKFDINDVWDAVDSIFDFGDSNFFSWLRLNEEEQRKFWEIVSKLIKAGIIGYRYYEVNGHLERHFIEWEIANPRLQNAKVKYIDKRQYSRDWLV
ncbi:hypothetical protein D9V84_05305 [Bacteroidetes/Chlorobi group bacterium Naka2016]|jgi:hypothetical protein|nr:MAG: hypothetical protein D9V84_05305 [Bacteroidetes/Chlorobi group bacterium Naka2016]